MIAALEHIRPGDVLVINAFGFEGRAVIGDNLAQRFDVFGAVGAIVDGYVRDGAIIERLGFPVFARGLTPAGPFKNGPGTIGESVAIGGVVVEPGDIVVADADGVIVIPPHRAEEALAAVKEIVAREADLDAEVETLRRKAA
ncbi:RraA family protein [Streptomyces sp. MBT65]|uniref:RraA family protein n=1 Tax=Streptomyces sp. MBT65 TaxID=1488395 RepID=UPI0035AEF768